MMYKTKSRKLSPTQAREHGPGFIRAEFGECTIGTQPAYYSVTAEISSTGRFADRSVHSCGCLHEAVRAAFPVLAPTIRWHSSNDGVPMHYLANAEYWWDLICHPENYTPNNVPQRRSLEEVFAQHVVLLEGEDLGALLACATPAALRTALEARIPALRAAYAADVAPVLALGAQRAL